MLIFIFSSFLTNPELHSGSSEKLKQTSKQTNKTKQNTHTHIDYFH
jgi:hypothetical protein